MPGGKRVAAEVAEPEDYDGNPWEELAAECEAFLNELEHVRVGKRRFPRLLARFNYRERRRRILRP